MTTETLKCVIVGDSETGNAELMAAMAPKSKGSTTDSERMIFDSRDSEYKVRERLYKCSFFAPSSQGELDRMRPLLYQGTDIFIITFRIDDIYSFTNVKNKWHLELSQSQNIHHVPFLLVGLKSDMRKGVKSNDPAFSKLVSKNEAEELSKDLKSIGYIEFSAKLNEGSTQIMKTITTYVDNTKYPHEADTGGCGCCIQ